MTSGALPQLLHLLGAPLGAALPAPLGTGPYKIVLADSGLPDLDTLTTFAVTYGQGHLLGPPAPLAGTRDHRPAQPGPPTARDEQQG